MPKVKENTYSRLHSYVSEFERFVFSINKSVLFCKLCEVKVSAEKRFTVLQHLKTEKYIRSINKLIQMCRPKNFNLTKIFVKPCYLLIFL